MSVLTPEQVRHIAKLARLTLTEAEERVLALELTGILHYVDMLQEVNTEGVEPTAQSIELQNVFRKDEVYAEPLASPDDLLQTSALPIVDHQIQTPSAHG